MAKFIDRTGQVFGRLTVISRAANDRYSQALWNCRCECGKMTSAPQSSLTSGKKKSCGCLIAEAARRNGFKAIPVITTHGESAKYRKSSLYGRWDAMIQRCHNPNNAQYVNYGARGIAVCPEWRFNYEAFRADMGEPPRGLSLDRIDTNKGYSADNCRWTSARVQVLNQRRALHFCDIDGQPISMGEIAHALAMRPNACRAAFIRSGIFQPTPR